MAKSYKLVVDLGTTKAKVFLFDESNNIIAKKGQDLHKQFPATGWVEQDPFELVEVPKLLLRSLVEENKALIGGVENIRSIGFTNQRETTIIWDRNTGRPVNSAIVWKDERTKDYCESLKGEEEKVREKTGLPIDPYFSASKIRWILDNKVDGGADNLCFGTPDSWLLYNLGEGHPHKTDITNASRTLLYNIREMAWDDDLLSIFDIPKSILSTVQPTISGFGYLDASILGVKLPIKALCGDQEASLYAAGEAIGTTKVTYGTGAFISEIIGDEFALHEGFFTTLVAMDKMQGSYAVEAKVNMGSADVSPLLHVPGKEEELQSIIEKIAQEVDKYLQRLPIKPETLIIDGGISEYAGHLDKIQSEVSGLDVKLQSTSGGTALGVAKMLG